MNIERAGESGVYQVSAEHLEPKLQSWKKTNLRSEVFLWSLLLLLCLLLFAVISRHLEASLIGHMLVQIPMLIVGGTCAAVFISDSWRGNINYFNGGGIPGIVLATVTLAFWMIPKSLDAALASPIIGAIKYLSVPLLVGAPLTLSWPLLGFVGKSFVVLNAAAMLMAVGYLYLIAPVRLCNAYLINEQEPAGYILIIFSGMLVTMWLLVLITGINRTSYTS